MSDEAVKAKMNEKVSKPVILHLRVCRKDKRLASDDAKGVVAIFSVGARLREFCGGEHCKRNIVLHS